MFHSPTFTDRLATVELVKKNLSKKNLWISSFTHTLKKFENGEVDIVYWSTNHEFYSWNQGSPSQY